MFQTKQLNLLSSIIAFNIRSLKRISLKMCVFTFKVTINKNYFNGKRKLIAAILLKILFDAKLLCKSSNNQTFYHFLTKYLHQNKHFPQLYLKIQCLFQHIIQYNTNQSIQTKISAQGRVVPYCAEGWPQWPKSNQPFSGGFSSSCLLHFNTQYDYTIKDMINNRVNKINTFHHASRYPLVTQLQNHHSSIDYSYQYCSCVVETDFKLKGQCIIIYLKCRPQKFVFEGIDFSLKILLNCINTHLPVIVYNDRRVFHPNINLINCQLISKNLKSEIKSLDLLNGSLQVFEGFVRKIMEIIISPDCSFVADNLYNRKAAWHYIYNRANYKYLILEHCPANLNKAIVGHYHHNVFQEVNSRSRDILTDKSQSFWNIQFTHSKLQQPFNSLSDYDCDDFSERRIKRIKDECYSDNVTQINETEEKESLYK